MTSNDEPVVAELDELHDDFIYFVRVNDSTKCINCLATMR
jgi:hypothetical protein